jgi:opacity protein-like surface antigen
MTPRALLSTLVLSLLSAPAAADGVDWVIAPYGWLPSVSVDQSFDDGSGGDDGGSSEVLSKIDFAVMLHVEAAGARWGAMLDYIYVSLADQTSFSVPPVIDINIEGDLDLDVLELGGFYRQTRENSGIDYLFGLRNINADIGVVSTRQDLPPATVGISAEVTDVFVGARYLRSIGKSWNLGLRGDYGFGDSDGTLNLLATIGLQFNETIGLKFGYRHATIEFEEDLDGAPETTDISLSGPFVGVAFSF